MSDVRHPSKYNDEVLSAIADLIPEHTRVLDVMAGTGKIFELEGMVLGVTVSAIEIEPEWASMHPRTQVGNALCLPFEDGSFDVIATSPVYGNRMSDKHNAKDESKRHTYRHSLGRPLHPDNAGNLQWGEKYRQFHVAAWKECKRVLGNGECDSDKWFVLNCKDHIRGGVVQRVCEWHVETLESLGFELSKTIYVSCPGLGHGANREARVPFELVCLLVLPGRSKVNG